MSSCLYNYVIILILFVLYPSAPPPPFCMQPCKLIGAYYFFSLISLVYNTLDFVMHGRASDRGICHLFLAHVFYQISYIDDCDDVDKLMGAEWVYHKEVWRSLWQLREIELCGA